MLVLSGAADAQHPGNLALDGLFGARVVLGGDPATVADELGAAGETPFLIPLGGSSATGARGYLACAQELQDQAPDAAHVATRGRLRRHDGPGERTVWLHTGGLPGLFGHPFAESAAHAVLAG